MLAFTSVYFSEMSIFNGLRAFGVKILLSVSGPFSAIGKRQGWVPATWESYHEFWIS
jgi:hypothetical protein